MALCYVCACAHRWRRKLNHGRVGEGIETHTRMVVSDTRAQIAEAWHSRGINVDRTCSLYRFRRSNETLIP